MSSTDPSPGLAVVTLTRTDDRDVGHRQVYVRIDDRPSHTLLFGDSVRVEIAAGSHRLRANNTLIWKSVPFDAEPGQHIEFALINRASRFGFGVLALLGVAPLMLSIERRR